MKLLASTLVVLLLAATFLPALAEAPDATKTYTVEEMIAWAMQDEVDAEAAYQSILQKFGQELRPFSAIVKAERNHQSLLMPFMEKYGLAMPEPAAFTAPETFQEALLAGVEAEENNIAMYEKFLAQGDVPGDIALVFERLLSASKNHLEAFTRGATRNGGGRWNNSEPGFHNHKNRR